MMKRFKSIVCGVVGLMLVLGVRGAEPAGKTDAKEVGPKSCQIRNQKFGNLLRPEEANSANGTPIVLYPAQPWKCLSWRLHPCGEAQFTLQNHFTSKTFAAEAGKGEAPAAVKQVPFGKSPEERPVWRFTKLDDGAYKITDTKSGKALTAGKEDSSSTVKVTVQAWQGASEQKWELIEIDPKELTM